MDFDPETISKKACYQLLVGAVLPRPIAWVSTLNKEGVSNLAPFSFFTVASCAPPVLLFTQVNPRDLHEKDTLRNLRDTRECVVNIVDAANAEVMNLSSGEYPYGASEFAIAGIGQCASVRVAPPGVEGAPVRFECRLREIQAISPAPSGGHVVLLDVLRIVVDDRVLRDGLVDPAALDAIGKMGGDGYCLTRERFEMKRPTVAAHPEKTVR